MKELRLLFVLSVFFFFVPLSGQVSSLEPVKPEELEWFYTLAVQKHSDHFSISLMKEGWLSFDTWGDGAEFEQHRIEVSKSEFGSLKNQFEELHEKAESFKESADVFPSYAFEKVSNTVTTFEFSGDHPEVITFLKKLSEISGVKLPFEIN